MAGDEPVLLARRTGAPVAVGSDRPAAAQLLVNAGCDVVVSDDGLQHYALVRDCEIVVIDGDRRFGNGWLLPAGPLREPKTRLDRVDAVVVNGGGAPLEGALCMRLEAGEALGVRGGEVRALDTFAGYAVHAVAGIGNPERFFNLLRAHGIEVTGHALPDPAGATAGGFDTTFPDDRPVIMTEERCRQNAKLWLDPQHWYVPVTASFDAGDSTVLLDIVTRAMAMHRACA